ncbi:MAG: RNA polymerase sigma factor [Planctomycetes bacterium]|nr:RNA polymerase sigma factor [Planctomycetota bacterium]
MSDPRPTSDGGDPAVRMVIRAQLGDRDALEGLLVWTRPWLWRCLRAMLPEHDAEDALQEVMLTAARRLVLLEEPRAYRSWVYRIATRHAVRALSKRRSFAALDSVATPAAPHAAAPDADELERLKSEVSRLTPNSLAVMVLHYYEGLSIARVSAVLGEPEGTVKSRLNTALGALRRSLASGSG